jgi:hypothetical protein
MVTAVVVTFAIGGVLKLSTRRLSSEPPSDDVSVARIDSDRTPVDEETPQAIPTTRTDVSMIEELLRAADAIEALAKEGRRVCDALGEAFYDYEQPGPDGDEHIAKWNQFAREWDDDLTEVATRLPSPPGWDADDDVTTSYQEVAGAIQELRNATMGSGSSPIPSERDWSAHFDEAGRRLEQARARLAARVE